MAIIIQKPTSDLYLTQNEYNRLLAKYQQAFQFYSGTPPTFETWAKQQKEYERLAYNARATAQSGANVAVERDVMQGATTEKTND